jgi:ADP-ribose pyrophosphatase
MTAGPALAADQLADEPASWPVVSAEVLARGAITSYVDERVMSPADDVLDRQFARHPGAVGVIALDDQDRAVLVRQYRHPARHRLIEPPAGLLDVAGEDPLTTAQRELAEEAGLAAADWRVLVDTFTSPGALSEAQRMYLARDLSTVNQPAGFQAAGEEAEMDIVWAGLNDLAAAVLGGRLHSPTLIAGVLAAVAAKGSRGGYENLRPADADWPARRELLQRQSPDPG